MIVGISGFIGSGKDTIANHLVYNHGFRKESFASLLKDIVALTFSWDRTMLEGNTNQSREWREQVDQWWANRLGIPQLTPRWVLQHWGTEVLRKGFHDDIWIASLENKLRNKNDNIVISDCRFPNEIKSIQKSGGKNIWVRRGELPPWYSIALAANHGHTPSIQELKRINIHASETSWVGTEFDYVIWNDSTVDDLYKKVETILIDKSI